MSVPLLRSDYTSTKDLAGIFSGWIVAIVGFYFLQQNAEKAQASSSDAVKAAASATQQATTANQQATTAAQQAVAATQQAITAADKAASASAKVLRLSALHESAIADFQSTVTSFAKQLGERKELGGKAVAAPEEFKAALDAFVRESDRKAQDARFRAQKLLAE